MALKMGTSQQQEELHRTFWGVADDLRGAIGGWEFKAYVLGTLFYRFISENLTECINTLQREAGIDVFDYAQMEDPEAEAARVQMCQEKGFFILPSQLLANVCRHCEDDVNLNMTLSNAIKAIEASAIGTDSDDDMKGLFLDFNVDSSKLVSIDDILENESNLSVSTYVEQEDTREFINIKEVNATLQSLIAKGNELNAKIDVIVK